MWKRSNDAVVCKWNNKRDVVTISNRHSVEMVPVPNKHGQLTTKPNTVRDYNNGMSGVDWSDQMFSYYQRLRKFIQWYKKIGVHFLDIFFHNSFYLTKQLVNDLPSETKGFWFESDCYLCAEVSSLQ